MSELDLLRISVEFWGAYRLIIAEAVFMGIIAAKVTTAIAKWAWRKFDAWDRKGPPTK